MLYYKQISQCNNVEQHHTENTLQISHTDCNIMVVIIVLSSYHSCIILYMYHVLYFIMLSSYHSCIILCMYHVLYYPMLSSYNSPIIICMYHVLYYIMLSSYHSRIYAKSQLVKQYSQKHCTWVWVICSNIRPRTLPEFHSSRHSDFEIPVWSFVSY